MRIETALMAAVVTVGFGLLAVDTALAHCDTTGGPVIPEAKGALEKGDVIPILKWVKKDNEAEVKAAFAKAVAVRAKGPEAKELADQYFLETLVRLHRAGEGAPYTGIKDEPVELIVAMSDKALADGSADELIKKINGHLAEAVKARFNKALEAKKNKHKSVEAGREFVEAYVIYTHYVEGIHTAIMSAGEHQHAGSTPSAPEQAEHREHTRSSRDTILNSAPSVLAYWPDPSTSQGGRAPGTFDRQVSRRARRLESLPVPPRGQDNRKANKNAPVPTSVARVSKKEEKRRLRGE